MSYLSLTEEQGEPRTRASADESATRLRKIAQAEHVSSRGNGKPKKSR